MSGGGSRLLVPCHQSSRFLLFAEARPQYRGTWQAALLAPALAAQDERVRLRVVLRLRQQRAHRLAHL